MGAFGMPNGNRIRDLVASRRMLSADPPPPSRLSAGLRLLLPPCILAFLSKSLVNSGGWVGIGCDSGVGGCGVAVGGCGVRCGWVRIGCEWVWGGVWDGMGWVVVGGVGWVGVGGRGGVWRGIPHDARAPPFSLLEWHNFCHLRAMLLTKDLQLMRRSHIDLPLPILIFRSKFCLPHSKN